MMLVELYFENLKWLSGKLEVNVLHIDSFPLQTRGIPHSERVAEGENSMQGPGGRVRESYEHPQVEKTRGKYSN